MKKLLGIIVLGLLLSGNAYAADIVLVCKFNYGKHHYDNGNVEKFGDTLGAIRDDIFKINDSKKTLIEIRTSGEKIVKDVSWSSSVIMWERRFDLNPPMVFFNKINRFNGVYISRGPTIKNSKSYEAGLRDTLWFYDCSKSKKLF